MGRLQRLTEFATYLSSPATSTVYSGFVGYNNLGDEVLWEQIHKAFAPMRLVCAPPSTRNLRKRILEHKKHESVILGGGTLIGGNLPDGSNPFRDHYQRCRAHARRAVAFGTGVGRLSEDPAENSWLLEWKPLLDEFEYIGVRGPMSVRSLASIGIDAELLGDPACLISQGLGFWSPPRTKVLGINVGELYRKSGADTAKEQNLVDILSNLIKERARSGWRIEFFVVTPSDCPIVDRVINQSSVTNYKIYHIYNNGYHYLNAAKHVTAFVGMKLHSVILAMCAGVPSIMVSYSQKCNDFMMSVELDEFVIDVEHVTMESLNSKLETLVISSNKIKYHITKIMNYYRAKQLGRAEIIRSQHFIPAPAGRSSRRLVPRLVNSTALRSSSK
jgi:polysaccharide pyruvyl transferase WcaK-like protein